MIITGTDEGEIDQVRVLRMLALATIKQAITDATGSPFTASPVGDSGYRYSNEEARQWLYGDGDRIAEKLDIPPVSQRYEEIMARKAHKARQ